jgi:predicted RNA-binding Zn ribbon-like protein
LHFAPDTEATLEFIFALGNTVAGATKSGTDELSTRAELTALLDEHRYSGRFDRDDTELAEVRETRDRLRRIWMLERDLAAVEVNRLLSEGKALPYLVRHDSFDWHLHATDQQAPLAERIRVEAGLALMDVVRSNEMQRLRHCAAPDCEGLLLDLSRNGSKRFCSVRCGNRMNMIAFRERAATEVAEISRPNGSPRRGSA